MKKWNIMQESPGLIKSLWRIGRLATVPWRHRVLSYPAMQQFCQDNHSLTCGNTEAYPTIFSISKDELIKISNQFKERKELRTAAAVQGITGQMYDNLLVSFCNLLEDPSQYADNIPLTATVEAVHAGSTHIDNLFNHFITHAHESYPLLYVMPQLSKISDLTSPAQWYPAARSMKRHFVIHTGPTNSGKTHSALETFLKAKTGIYCAPLRMLTHEIYRTTNAKGVACDLVTGEEKLYASGDPQVLANHLACTVEMSPTDIGTEFEVAVIDEAQMIRDAERGGAWTRAILGIPAHEIHLCGEASIIDIVRRIVESVGDTVEVKRYERLNPLIPLNKSLVSTYSLIRSGDCVVVFSRNKIFSIKENIEAITGKRCAVVYGSLPSAIRLEQARLFNSPDSGVDVLVATDAIGMGLNLHIKRIIFYGVRKLDRKKFICLTPSQLQQISGRAGRYGIYDKGEVTTFHARDYYVFRKFFKNDIRKIQKAGLSPSIEQLTSLSNYLPNLKLHDLLSVFSMATKLDDNYFLCEKQLQVWKDKSAIISEYDLRLSDSIVFSFTPFKNLTLKKLFSSVFRLYVESASMGTPVTVQMIMDTVGWPHPKPKDATGLLLWEDTHELLDCYLWLNQRFPELFPEVDNVYSFQKEIERTVSSLLTVKRIQHRPVGRYRPKISPKKGSDPLHLDEDDEGQYVIIADEEGPVIKPIFKGDHRQQIKTHLHSIK